MKTKILLFVLSLMITGIISGQIIHVPADQPDIQSGINAAINGDTVLVAEGTYYENVRFMGKAITLASEYIWDGDTNHINNTIIDGSQAINPDSAACVMFVHGEDTTSILNGFTITKGSGVFNMTWQSKVGGGIFASYAGAKIVNNKIINNHVESNIAGGGGLAFLSGSIDTWAVIDNNIISSNTSTAHGVSAFGGGISVTINAVIKNNTIENNSCTNDDEKVDGGGIELERLPGASPLDVLIHNNIIRYNVLNGINNALGAGINSVYVAAVITNNTITYNQTNAVDYANGGGVYIFSSINGATIKSNIINNNSCAAHYSYGGGIRAWNSGYLLIENNEINNNIMTGEEVAAGGGIWINNPLDSIRIVQNTIISNELTDTTFGGGIGIYNCFDHKVLISRNFIKGHIVNKGAGIFSLNSYNSVICNNILVENEASEYGGALYFRHYAKDDDLFDHGVESTVSTQKDFLSINHPLVVNNTIIGNSAYRGGAVYTDHEAETPIFMNTLFWGNEASNNYDEIYNPSGETLEISFCNINEAEISSPISGHENIFEDPVFLDPECHLAWPSPCIGAGTESIEVGGVTYNCPDTDFDGEPRPQCVLVDIGADESPFGVGIVEATQQNNNLKINPNPSSGIININYKLKDVEEVSISLMNIQGELLQTHIIENQTIGENSTILDLSHLPDGLYLIRLQAGNQVETAKVILIK